MAAAAAVENVKARISKSVEIPILTKCCFCIPLRKGLITMAYLNLVLTAIVLTAYAGLIYSYEHYNPKTQDEAHLLPQLVIELISLFIEVFMTIVFLVGLHRKMVPLMRSYLYFGIVYMVFSVIYNIVIMCIYKETANEFTLIVSQLVIHFYFMILVWSSIVKMERDGSVKYTRSEA